MPDWIVYVLIFAAGIGVGAFLATNFFGKSQTAGTNPDKRKTLSRLYKKSPVFFDALRADLMKPEGRQVREFAILASSRITFVSDELRFVYYKEDMPEVTTIVEQLESNGFVDDISPGKTPIYRIRDSFIATLEAL